MSYYDTYYDLKVYEGEKTIQEVLEELSVEEKYSYLHFYAVDNNGNPYEPCNWYEHEEEMKGVSKMYPDIVFVLNAKGILANNLLWCKYFKNGKMQSCPAIVTFDKFDEEKLR